MLRVTYKADPDMSTRTMENHLARYFNVRACLVVPNISWGMFDHEADLIVLTDADYGYEIEIKRDVADLKADFDKAHGHSDKTGRIAKLFYALGPMIAKEHHALIPQECGLLTLDNYGRVTKWRDGQRRAHARKWSLEDRLKLTRLAYIRYWYVKMKIEKLEDQ